MPEGDSIFRAARALNEALAGRTVHRFASVLARLNRVDRNAPLAGRTIDGVTPRGKHLLIWFSGDLVLHTHLRMHGSWHLYRPGERWQRPRHDMRIVLTTDAWEAVAFDVPVAEFLSAHETARAPALRELGPDLLADEFDPAEALRRLEALRDMPIGDALLDQSVMAGIGNIYKSEVLFACGLSPFTPVRDVPHARRMRLVTTARRILQANADARATRRAVYSRGGQPCRRCGTPIMRQAQGPHARSTYWCPKCQAPGQT